MKILIKWNKKLIIIRSQYKEPTTFFRENIEIFNHSNVNQRQIYEKKIYKNGVNENQLFLGDTNVVKTNPRISNFSNTF